MITNKPIASLFDLDGVVLDTEGQYTVFWGEMGRRYTDVEGFEFRIKGMTLKQILDRYFGDAELQKAVVAELVKFEDNMQFPYIKGVESYLAELKANNVRLAVVTSSDKSKMQSVYRQHPELPQMFNRILTAEDFTASKPAPDCYLLGAHVFDTVIDNCVVYEDSVNGLKAGQSAGMKVVGLTTTNPAEVVSQYANKVIPSFEGFGYADMLQLIR